MSATRQIAQSARRYIFSGHTVGVAAQFNRLDQVQNLDHVIPVLGACALPETGGMSQGQIADYSFDVTEPRPRTLLSVHSVRTSASGKISGTTYQTEIEADIQNIMVVDKLRMDRVYMNFRSVRDALNEDADPVVSTRGSVFEGIRLGTVEATIAIDEEPLQYCGCKNQLAQFYRNQTPEYRRAYSWRFGTAPEAADIAEYKGCCKWSIVREIRLSGPEVALQDISVDGYTIVWKGFGKIILGEYLVKGEVRRLTMARLAMGSDAGGDGSVGDGESNGQFGG